MLAKVIGFVRVSVCVHSLIRFLLGGTVTILSSGYCVCPCGVPLGFLTPPVGGLATVRCPVMDRCLILGVFP